MIGKIYYRYGIIFLIGKNSWTRNTNIQCAIPAFEGLFPGIHDTIVRKLLFELATWHGLAKLRLHTETTVCDLENSTTRLGELLRTFQSKVCSKYQTFDLPSEEAARVRRKAATAKKRATMDKGKGKETSSASQAKKGVTMDKGKTRKTRTLNLNTYKTHALGAYAKAIRLYGSPDNYNSQTVCKFSMDYLIVIQSYTYHRVNSSTGVESASLKVYARDSMQFLA